MRKLSGLKVKKVLKLDNKIHVEYVYDQTKSHIGIIFICSSTGTYQQYVTLIFDSAQLFLGVTIKILVIKMEVFFKTNKLILPRCLRAPAGA